jgi:hypothetical protein
MKLNIVIDTSRTEFLLVGILFISACLQDLIPFAVLKDGLISSFQKQLSDREEQVQTLTAELNSCYARLLESDSLLERFPAI